MDIGKKLTGKRGKLIIALLVAIGILFIMFPSENSDTAETRTEGIIEISTYTEKLEDKICNLCLAVDGVADVRVLVTLDCSSEFVYADNRTENVASSGSSYSSDYLIIENKNGTSPVTVTEIYPRIRGVAVVCRGGDTPQLKSKLTYLLSAALGIPTSKISVTS